MDDVERGKAFKNGKSDPDQYWEARRAQREEIELAFLKQTEGAGQIAPSVRIWKRIGKAAEKKDAQPQTKNEAPFSQEAGEYGNPWDFQIPFLQGRAFVFLQQMKKAVEQDVSVELLSKT